MQFSFLCAYNFVVHFFLHLYCIGDLSKETKQPNKELTMTNVDQIHRQIRMIKNSNGSAVKLVRRLSDGEVVELRKFYILEEIEKGVYEIYF